MLALNPLKWVNAFDVTGDYDMQTWVTLTGGTKWAFRLDGLITRAGVHLVTRPSVCMNG